MAPKRAASDSEDESGLGVGSTSSLRRQSQVKGSVSTPAHSGSDSDDDFVPKPAAKRPRASTSTASKAKKSTASPSAADAVLALAQDELEVLEKNQLVQHVVTLQKHCKELKAQGVAAAGSGAAPKMTQEQIQAKAEQARNVMVKGINAQFKWKPSCKQGGAKWSYAGVVPSPEVFLALFKQDASFKLKTLKLSKDAFESDVCRERPVGKVRYAHLYITSDVNVRWQKEDGTFTVGGSYGIGY